MRFSLFDLFKTLKNEAEKPSQSAPVINDNPSPTETTPEKHLAESILELLKKPKIKPD